MLVEGSDCIARTHAVEAEFTLSFDFDDTLKIHENLILILFVSE